MDTWLATEYIKGTDVYNTTTPVGLINLLTRTVNEQSTDTEAERTTLFPIRDITAYKFYKQQEAAIWSILKWNSPGINTIMMRSLKI